MVVRENAEEFLLSTSFVSVLLGALHHKNPCMSHNKCSTRGWGDHHGDSVEKGASLNQSLCPLSFFRFAFYASIYHIRE